MDDPRQDLVVQRLQAELSDLLRELAADPEKFTSIHDEYSNARADETADPMREFALAHSMRQLRERRAALEEQLIPTKKVELYDRITALWNDANVAKLSRCLNHRLAGIAVHVFKVGERPLNIEEIEAVRTAYTRMTMTHDGTFEMVMVDPTQPRVDRLRDLVEVLLAEQRGPMLPMKVPFNILPFVAKVAEPIDDETFERVYYHLFGAPPNTTKAGRVEYMRGLYGAYLEDRSWDLREYVEQAPLEDANAVRAVLNNRPEMRSKKPL